MFALIYVASFDRGILATALHWQPLQTMGEWSFAVYIGQRRLAPAHPLF